MLGLPDHLTLRLATLSDLPALSVLMSVSITQFCSGYYTPTQVPLIVSQAVAGRYNELISRSTYFVICDSHNPDHVVASAGWTPHRTVYSESGSSLVVDETLDPHVDAVWIRGLYVHPDYAGRRLALLLVQQCEAAARERGFARFQLASSLNAVRFYQRCGYVVTEEKLVGLSTNESAAVVMMEKS